MVPPFETSGLYSLQKTELVLSLVFIAQQSPSFQIIKVNLSYRRLHSAHHVHSMLSQPLRQAMLLPLYHL